MYWNQPIGRVAFFGGLTSNNEELVLGSTFVATVGILPCSETALSHVNRLQTPVTVVPAIPADSVGQITDGSHMLEGVMQKGILRLTVLSIIIDTTHCFAALKSA